MPVDMGQEGAQPVSALATVRSANTPLDQQHLVQHRLTALRAMLVDMEQEAALRASALVTVLLVGTRRRRLVRAQRRLTVSAARLGHILMPRAALSVSSVLLVRTRMQ